MATEILAADTAANTSNEFTATAGETVTLFLKTGPGAGEDLHPAAFVELQWKTATGDFITQTRMGGSRPPAISFGGPMIYRIKRPQQANGVPAVGVEKG